jgi:hypothetical protein
MSSTDRCVQHVNCDGASPIAGGVRPSTVLDLLIEPATSDGKPEWQNLFSQLRLLGPQQKPLRKLPYTTSSTGVVATEGLFGDLSITG